MHITFLGVGEACDPLHGNTAILVQPDGEATSTIMLDCGFTTPHRYFGISDDAEELQALWISHFHGDHFMGVPLLFLRFWEMGRRTPLMVLGPQGVADKVWAAMDLAYPGFRRRLTFSVEFVPLEPGQGTTAAGVGWRSAAIDHSQAALSVRIDDSQVSVFYSGDGRPTPASSALAMGTDVIVHEAFHFLGDTDGHGSVQGCLEFARQAGARLLALVHMERNDRKQYGGQINEIAGSAAAPQVLLPESGDRLVV
jgi:ribonuclease Z